MGLRPGWVESRDSIVSEQQSFASGAASDNRGGYQTGELAARPQLERLDPIFDEHDHRLVDDEKGDVASASVRRAAIRRIATDKSGDFTVEPASGAAVRGSRRYRPAI